MLRSAASLLCFLLVLIAVPVLAQETKDGFLVATPEGDTLFYAGPGGELVMGLPALRTWIGRGGEGFESVVTDSVNHPSAGIFRVTNPDNRGTALLSVSEGGGPAILGAAYQDAGVRGYGLGAGTFGGLFYKRTDDPNDIQPHSSITSAR